MNGIHVEFHYMIEIIPIFTRYKIEGSISIDKKCYHIQYRILRGCDKYILIFVVLVTFKNIKNTYYLQMLARWYARNIIPNFAYKFIQIPSSLMQFI
jgi:hypothetical protein